MTHIADNLTHKELELLHAHGTRVTVPQGWSLMWERTPADKTYLIVAGEVAIRRNNVEVARLGPGDVVGAMAVVNQKLRTAKRPEERRGGNACVSTCRYRRT